MVRVFILLNVAVAKISCAAKVVALSDQEPSSLESSCLLQRQKNSEKVLTHAARRDSTSDSMSGAEPQTFRNCELPSAKGTSFDAKNDLSFENYTDHDHSLQGLFVYPPKKFAFCLIEKNGCSTWIKRVLQPLLYKNGASCEEGSYGCQDGKDYDISGRSQQQFGDEGINSVFQDPSATRAVFVRDPMERFASAFINKCIDENMEKNCPMKSKVFRDAVEWAATSDMTTVEGHWLPQAFHCQLNKRIAGYNGVFLMKRDTFTHDMNCLLARIGMDDLIEDVQPNLLPSNHSNDLTTMLQKLFTPEAARKFIAKVPYDYDVFGFSKEPDWIAGATGEWYEKEFDQRSLFGINAALQRSERVRRTNGSSSDDDADDLVEQVFRAGYGA